MRAFHNDTSIKEKYLSRLRSHAEADEFIKGKYWENGKGCAVGCTIRGNDHSKYETELGIPEWLAHIEDVIFEGLPDVAAKKWPIRFLSAIKVGSDLDKIKTPFLIFVVESTLDKFNHKKFPDIKKSIDGVLSAFKSGDKELLMSAEAAAARAAWAATEAAARAARAAAEAAARAARAAAEAAWAATEAAGAAARAAAGSAAEAAWAATEAAWASYEKFADKLIELMEAEE